MQKDYYRCTNKQHLADGSRCKHDVCRVCHFEEFEETPYWTFDCECFYCIANDGLDEDWLRGRTLTEILFNVNIFLDIGFKDAYQNKQRLIFFNTLGRTSMIELQDIYEKGYKLGTFVRSADLMSGEF